MANLGGIIRKSYNFELTLDFGPHFVVYSFQQQVIQQLSSDNYGVAGFLFQSPNVLARLIKFGSL